MSHSTMVAPQSASCRASSRPSPWPAPVTTHTSELMSGRFLLEPQEKTARSAPHTARSSAFRTWTHTSTPQDMAVVTHQLVCDDQRYVFWPYKSMQLSWPAGCMKVTRARAVATPSNYWTESADGCSDGREKEIAVSGVGSSCKEGEPTVL